MNQRIQEGIDLLDTKGEPEAAAEKFEDALREELSNTDQAMARLQLGRIRLLQDRSIEAEEQLEQAVTADPSCGEAYSLLGVIASSEGDTKRALESLQRGVQVEPKAFVTQYSLGKFLFDERQYEQALPHYERAALELAPNAANVRFELGLLLMNLGQDQRALEQLAMAFSLDPRQSGAAALLAAAMIRARNHQEAEKLLKEAIQHSPDDLDLIGMLVQVSKAQLQLGQALHCARRWAELAPENPEVLYELAFLALANGEFEESERAAKALAEAAPADWRGPYLLGMLYETVKLRDQAKDNYLQAVEFASAEWQPRNNLGTLLLEEDDLDEVRKGIDHLEKARSLTQDKEPKVLYNLALGYVKVGERQKGIDYAKRVAGNAQAADELRQQSTALVKALAAEKASGRS